MSEMRETDGIPVWLPGNPNPRFVKREKKAYRHDEQGKAMIETGLFETGQGFIFTCPLCGNTVRNDQRMEPMCTGPSWTDDHPPEVMLFVSEVTR